MLVLAGVMTGISSVLTQIAGEFGIPPTRAGILYTAHFAGFMVLVFATVGANGLRRRLVVTTVAAILYVPALFLVGSAPALWILIPALFLCGGTGGLLESHTAAVQVMTAENAAAAGAIVSFTQIFFALGALTVPLYLSVTAANASAWRVLFLALGVVAIANAALAVTIRHDRFEGYEDRPGTIHGRTLLRVATALAFYVGAEITLFGWAPTVMELYRGIPATRARLAPSHFWIGMLTGRYVVARLATRISPATMLRISAVGGITAAIVMSLAPFEWLLWVAVAVVALSCAGMWPLIVAASGDSGHEAGTIITVAAGSLGASIFPYLAGRTAEFLPGTLIPLTGAVLLGVVLLLVGTRRSAAVHAA